MDVSIASYYIERETKKIAEWGILKKNYKKLSKKRRICN
jgi:hypothetical protein